MHKTDNSDIAIEKYTDHGGQSARALEKWEGLAYACEYAIPAEFYFKTVAVFSLPCWHLICFDILCRSRSVTNTKHYESMTQWVTTTLPRGAPCCQGSPLVVKVVGGEQASSLWWCCCARSPSTGENHLSRIFAAHHQPAPSPHNDLDRENVNSVLVSSNGKANNSRQIMYLQTCDKKMSSSKSLRLLWDIDLEN